MMVFDSSTLILLAKIDILELFISDFHGRILIPEKVMLEVSAGGGEERHLIVKLIEDRIIRGLKVKNVRQGKKVMEDFNIESGGGGG